MGLVISSMSMSLDGFVTGPNDSRDHPLGEGGERLHEWLFGSRTERDAEIINEFPAFGAIVMGRRSYDFCEGDGGWGDAGPQGRTPCFVLTHRPPDPEKVTARSVFTFVTDGIESAVEQAQKAADGRHVGIHGASAAQQCLQAGLLDEVQIHLVPVLLGGGVRLFDHLGTEIVELRRTRVVESDAATHVRFRVVK